MATGLSPSLPSIPAAPTHPPTGGKPADAGPPARDGFLELSADFFISRLPLPSFFCSRGLAPRPLPPLVPIHRLLIPLPAHLLCTRSRAQLRLTSTQLSVLVSRSTLPLSSAPSAPARRALSCDDTPAGTSHRVTCTPSIDDHNALVYDLPLILRIPPPCLVQTARRDKDR